MILGDLPPNSRVTLFRLPAADCWMIFPTEVEPVNATWRLEIHILVDIKDLTGEGFSWHERLPRKKPTLSMSGWLAIAPPAVGPKPANVTLPMPYQYQALDQHMCWKCIRWVSVISLPVMTLTTPSGKPASLTRPAIWSPVRGVCSASFITTQFPVARAGPSFQACRVEISSSLFFFFNSSLPA